MVPVPILPPLQNRGVFGFLLRKQIRSQAFQKSAERGGLVVFVLNQQCRFKKKKHPTKGSFLLSLLFVSVIKYSLDTDSYSDSGLDPGSFLKQIRFRNTD